MKKAYEQYSVDERIEATLHDNDIHYLNGELDNENIAKCSWCWSGYECRVLDLC